MKHKNKIRCNKTNNGFTLAEAMAALAIAAMIMITVVAVYTTVKHAEAAVDRRIKGDFISTEVLQRIAEDIDRLALPGSDVTMSIKNKVDIEGFKISQMIIENKIYDKDNKPQTFEKVVWQSRVAMDGNGLIIYRAHSGYSLEDKMLEEPKEKYQREVYVPVCSGVSFFAMEVADGNTVTDNWTNTNLPPAVKISISFEPRQQDVLGNMSVTEESVKTRIAVINRFREIPYQFVYKEFGDSNDVNDVNDVNLPSDVNTSGDVNSLSNRKS